MKMCVQVILGYMPSVLLGKNLGVEWLDHMVGTRLAF